MNKIVILDASTVNPGDLSWDSLDQFGTVEVYPNTPDKLLVERAKDANIIVVNKIIVDAPLLAQLPKLQCICVSATGYNNIDIKATQERGIVVCNVQDYCSPSVAQRVFGYLLHFTDKIEQHNQAVQAGEWAKVDDFCFWQAPLVELAGKTIGIVGLGKIGSQVAKIAHAFDMDVLGVRRDLSKETASYISLTSLENLFTKSDFISIHTPLTSENAAVVNKSLLAKMKPSAYLINTARGGLVDELALKNALERRQIAGAALDVVSEEPAKNGNILFGIKNCIITPHNAWGTIESRRRMIQKIHDNVRAFLEGNPINSL